MNKFFCHTSDKRDSHNKMVVDLMHIKGSMVKRSKMLDGPEQINKKWKIMKTCWPKRWVYLLKFWKMYCHKKGWNILLENLQQVWKRSIQLFYSISLIWSLSLKVSDQRVIFHLYHIPFTQSLEKCGNPPA